MRDNSYKFQFHFHQVILWVLCTWDDISLCVRLWSNELGNSLIQIHLSSIWSDQITYYKIHNVGHTLYFFFVSFLHTYVSTFMLDVSQ